MNKDQAQRIIKDTFENKFDKARFTRFMVELLNLKSLAVSDHSVAFNSNQIPNAYQPFINSFEKIADYRSGEHKLDVLAIWLKKETSIERARTMQRNFIAWYLRGDCDGEMKDATLAAFVSPGEEDWRFSLVKIEYSLGEDKKGRVKISEEFTPAKRWSFLVGSNENSHTAQSQIVTILEEDEKKPTFAQLENAFNIEKVTKEFFKKYRELFFWTKETLDEILIKDSKIRSDFETKNINTVDFSKKLLGQIVFLYFLQKKGWFGVERDADWGTGPKNFLRELFKGKHGKFNNFFNDILEPLFYDALRIDRGANDDYHDKFNCKIPFLNGGLFDPINNYDWVHTDINLPDELFSNLDKTKEGDIGTGILDVFDRYNFTVKEDEPLEKEVAVDPEMLGKVFENLLEVKDRKSKGTYYTPREIVHYMCQQSLINYLDTEMEGKVSKDDIEKLIKYGEQFGENNTDLIDSLKDIPESIIQNAKLIDEKLADIKVCDPAVGSGAFLVGMMGEIVRSRNVLSNYIKELDRTIYNFKRDCIENSLYGVDIDPGAVEIAKLRLWLSLVVDEEDIKQIKPLPNLDYKIMQGNSLIEDFHGISLDIEERMNQSRFELGSNILEEENLVKDLYQKQKDYFNTLNPTEKLQKKQDIEDFILKFFSYEIQKKNIFDQEKAKVLEKELLLISQGNQQRNFFPWRLYFGDVFLLKNGFDIVIANPPYGFRNVLSKDEKEYFRKTRKIEFSSGDISELFVYYSFDKLVRNGGTLTFIIPKKSLYGESWKKLRNFWLKYQLLFLMDASKAFEEVLLEQQSFSLMKKQNNDNMIHVGALNNKMEKIVFFGSFKIKDISSNNLENAQIYRGQYDNLINRIENNKLQSSKSILRAKIGISNITQYLTFEKNGNYPCVKGIDISNYCLKKRERFLKREKAKNYIDFYNYKKIIAQEIIAHIQNPYPHVQIIAFYDQDKRLVNDTCVWIKSLANRLLDKFILAYIQSSFCNWYCYNIIYNKAIRTMHFIDYYVKQIPFPNKIFNKPELQKPVISLVDKIINIAGSVDYFENQEKQNSVEEYKKQIDNLIYKMWDFSIDEIYIIECK